MPKMSPKTQQRRILIKILKTSYILVVLGFLAIKKTGREFGSKFICMGSFVYNLCDWIGASLIIA